MRIPQECYYLPMTVIWHIVSLTLRTKLKKSTSADVLMQIHSPKHELLSQSTSVIASQGSTKKGHKIWFNMVSFDEDHIKAQRKYVTVVDERPKFLGVEPWEGLAFDCKVVLAADILDEPYSNDNARRIAILKNILENFRSDVREVAMDNKGIEVCAAMVNQALETVIVRLDAIPATPADAVRLSEAKGLQFEHISLDKGRIRLTIDDDIATVWENRLYGCMVCQEVCPKNEEVKPLPVRTDIGTVGASIPLREILSMDEAQYREKYRNNQISAHWIRFPAIQRNALLCAGNLHDDTMRSILHRFQVSKDPVLAHTARWAYSRVS